VRGSAGEIKRDLGTGALVNLETVSDIVEIALSGGAGFGDPLQCPLERVAQDVAQGLVTCEGALRDYGVVIDSSGNRRASSGSQASHSVSGARARTSSTMRRVSKASTDCLSNGLFHGYQEQLASSAISQLLQAPPLAIITPYN
jgi:hypothetical protein